MTLTAEPPIDADLDTRDARDPELRLEKLFDVGSLKPLREKDDSGAFAARGTINGAPVTAFCTDATTMGGAMGADGCRHIVDAIDAAVREHVPVIGVWHSGGARLAEGVLALHEVGLVFQAMIRASGRVPQISVVLGPAAGGAAYGPALTDLVIMSATGRVFVTGPDVVRSVTGETVDMESLGGADTHGRRSGVVHIVTGTDDEAFVAARAATDLFARQGSFDLSLIGPERDLQTLLPESVKRAYDVHPLVTGILDDDSFLELHAKWAPNIVTGLGRLTGRTVGVIANNPLRLGGCLDSPSAEKAARFVRMCDAFGIPLVVLVDVPGYLPGVGQEWDGIVRRGAKLLHAFGEAVVPRVTLVTRKTYGGAYIAMNSRALGANRVFAWPGAEVAVMGASAAVGILHRKKLAAAQPGEREALHAQLAEEHERLAGGVARAMELGVVDELIEPKHTRSSIVQALAAVPAARGAHGNIPL
ncbi:MAG: acetyl-CoA/propionyl-CoA carboxylase carboxyl transferase subunit [Pseudonocardiales bacterium]|jgi:acetyl-CoA/propionyl-CoA carboxylase carboxyl transferase subunit|nr:acetyl-CoA/propionyl-CoA carboxylase carboxyl transferase subunit [Pseudonocardiales bacterium]MDT4985718.1 acetyl-CoA/propionyl-CoA carboxylase carboxyl transferase subunit [Pseudonocardiales bacterium]